MSEFKTLLEEVRSVCRSHARAEDKMAQICRMLQEVDGYDWVGFYLVDPDRHDSLVLGPHVGSDNPHKELVFGKGVCGQVAERQTTIVVDNVADELNYLSLDPAVKSEIVLPLFRQGRLAGMLDVESVTEARFGDRDRLFLEEVCLQMTDQI